MEKANNVILMAEYPKPYIPMITLKNVSKSFYLGTEKIDILKNVDLTIRAGEKIAIVGPSGSGKTTLLSLIAGLDTPDEGEVMVAETSVAHLDSRGLARFRSETIGVVFQSFELVMPFTAMENVMAPLDIAGKGDKHERHATSETLLLAVGLSHRKGAMPGTLSGGEKQRVAIARALVMKPQVVLADEPTGSLDRMTGGKIIDLLLDQVAKSTATLVVITHDMSISEKMDRVFELRDGTLHEIS